MNTLIDDPLAPLPLYKKGSTMLRAPKLNPTPQPFNPNLQEILTPSHPTTPIPHKSNSTPDMDIETLNLILVKDAITTLHHEDKTQFQTLSAYTGKRIAEIVEEHNKFLQNQRNKYSRTLQTNQQKHLFETMTKAYFEQSLSRAKMLQQQMTRQFHIETVEKQNQEFLARALAPENALNDEAQTAYRNMILFNLENLYEDFPEAEKKTRLDEASKTLYEKIIEKRLEADPAAALPLLAATAVQRVLGDAAIQHYRQQADELKKDRELRIAAAEFVARELTPTEAKKEAAQKKDGDRQTLLRHYDELRYNENRKRYLTCILNMDSVWRDLMRNDANTQLLPAWVKNTAPALYDAVLENADSREKNGGLPPDPDYALLLEFALEYDPKITAERFREEKTLYSFITRLGGPDSPAFQAALRLMLGKATREDKAWFGDLGIAKKEATQSAIGETCTANELQNLLLRFDTARRIRLQRNGQPELEEFEVRDILIKLNKTREQNKGNAK